MELFVNLRATRATELRASFPSHVCNAWIGNSEIIANEHYVRVTDDDFEKASQKAAQNPAQYTAAYTGNNRQAEMAAHEKNPGFAGEC